MGLYFEKEDKEILNEAVTPLQVVEYLGLPEQKIGPNFCLCIIAIIPFIVSGLTGLSRLSFFGTSIIITVSVILETKKLILSKTQENYYMNRVKKGGLFRG